MAHGCSFVLSDLRDSLMVAHFFCATWAICSRSLICLERSERIGHSCSFDLSEMSKWTNKRWGNERIPSPGLRFGMVWAGWSSIFPKHPFRQVSIILLILFFKSSWWKIASAARKWINSVPPNSSDGLCLLFCLYPSSMNSTVPTTGLQNTDPPTVLYNVHCTVHGLLTRKLRSIDTLGRQLTPQLY